MHIENMLSAPKVTCYPGSHIQPHGRQSQNEQVLAKTSLLANISICVFSGNVKIFWSNSNSSLQKVPLHFQLEIMPFGSCPSLCSHIGFGAARG